MLSVLIKRDIFGKIIEILVLEGAIANSCIAAFDVC